MFCLHPCRSSIRQLSVVKDLRVQPTQQARQQQVQDVLHLQQLLQQEQERNRQLQGRLDMLATETRQQIYRAEQEKQQRVQDIQQQLQQERERSRQLQGRLDTSAQRVQEKEQELQRERERNRRLQGRLDASDADLEQIHPAAGLLTDFQFNNVNRREVQVDTNIGHGAWGEVARGRFKGQQVAVKWPHLILLQESPNMVDRMRREVKIMAHVRHPNLVRFIAAVLDEAVEQLRAPPLIITELLDTNLRQAYEQGRLQTTDCVTILRDVAYALHYLHDHMQPIIHRDISSPNILLKALPNKGWLAKVSDFGSANLAKLAHTAGEGAIIYSAPETFPHTDIHTEPPPMTTKIDVYSFGILICEVVTSQMPYPENIRGMMQQEKTKWEFMYDLTVRCTKHSPTDRPTMAEVLDDLNTLPRPPPRSLP